MGMDAPALTIDSVRRSGREVAIEDRVVLRQPFSTLRHYAKGSSAPQSPVLVVAPLSGHFSWLMRDTVVGLLPRHDVFLLEWKDVRDIPAGLGKLGLDRNIAEVMDALRTLGPGVSVLGVSQAPTAILAAASLLAQSGEAARPRAMVLMGGFIDPRINPTGVEKMSARLPSGWFSHVCAATVPPGNGGEGRRVYPAHLHRQALMRYLARHMAARGELFHKATADDGADPHRFPFLSLYSTLMDLPAEFAEDNSRAVFRESLLARGRLMACGYPVEPEALEDVALMTVEGGRDDSSGLGQTKAAHGLCAHLPDALRAHHVEAEAGHFGLFHGRLWRQGVLPRVEEFLRNQGRPPTRRRRTKRDPAGERPQA